MDTKIEKKKTNWIRIGLISAIILIVSWFAYSNIAKQKVSTLNIDMSTIRTDTIKQDIFKEFIPVTGNVQPIRSVVIAAVEGGRVEEKLMEDGTEILAGTPIVKLSNSELLLRHLNQEGTIISQITQIRNMSIMQEQQRLNLLETALNAEFRLDLLQRKVIRQKELNKDNVIARVEYEDTESEYKNLLKRNQLLQKSIEKDSLAGLIQTEQMESSLDLMKRNLEISKKNLENLTIKAPISGQLSGLNVEVGELIREGAKIGQIDDLSSFKIRVRIDEFYISRVFPEQTGSFSFANEDYELRIYKIYPQVINGSFEVDMKFIGKEPEGIRRGQTVTVKLQLSAEEKATLLKKGDFYQSSGGNWIYVVNSNGTKAIRRNIRIGRKNPNYYEVLEGLSDGDVVITSAYSGFEDKDKLVLNQEK